MTLAKFGMKLGSTCLTVLINVGGLIKKEIILHCPKTDFLDPDFVNGSWGKVINWIRSFIVWVYLENCKL